MPAFRACPECGFLVEQGSAHCPDCGLIFREGGFLDRLFKRAPERHPENYRSLEAKLKGEIARIETNIADYQSSLGPLQARIEQATAAGRSTRALEQAVIELQQGVTDARMLLQKHRALLTGIDIERRHNRVRVFLDEIGAARGDRRLPSLVAEGTPLARHTLVGRRVRFMTFHESGLLAVAGRMLYRIDDEAQVIAELPAGNVGAFAASRRFCAVGVGVTLAIYDLQGGAWLPAAQPRRGGDITAVSIAPDESWFMVGTARGALVRFTLAADPTLFPPREAHSESAHPGAVTAAAITRDGRRVISVGGGHVTNWWLMGDGLSQFSTRELAQATQLVFAADGSKLAVLRGSKVEVWDLGVTALEGAIDVGEPVNGLDFSPDGFRVLAFATRRVAVCSPASRSVFSLVVGDAPLQAVALEPNGVRLATAEGERAESTVVVRDLSRAGLVGWTLGALAEVRRAMMTARSMVKPGETGAAAAALRSQTRALVRDAGMAAVMAVTKRVEVLQQAANDGVGADEVMPHLQALFTELEDVLGVLEEATTVAASLEKAAAKLKRLPIAVLLGQADGVVAQIEGAFRRAGDADEAALNAELERLQGLGGFVERLQNLSNTLSGPFWGSPDRPKLNELLQHLKTSLPEIEDTLLARIASAAVGRADAVIDDVLLDNLRARQDRIRRGDGSTAGAADASVLLDELIDGGTLGADDADKERRAALDQMETARRDLNAETEAFLETRRLDD